MLRQLGMPSVALEGDLEKIYARHLLELVRESSLKAVVLLAHKQVHDPDGTPRPDLGSMFVPNDIVLDLARQRPEFVAGVSIHPARRDALNELDRCIVNGAALMKCLPNARISIRRTGVTFRSGKRWRRRAYRCLPTRAESTVCRS
jgi:uncharacterized protein